MGLYENIRKAVEAYQGKPVNLENMDSKALTEMTFNRNYHDSLTDVLLPRTNFDYQSEVAPMLNSAVTACVHWYMRTFPEAPIVVQQDIDGVKENLASHPVTELMRLPNQYYSGSTLLMGVIADYLVTGNGYILKVKTEGGELQELWYTPSSLIKPRSPKHDPKVFISHYEYRPLGQTIRIEREDVIHLRWGINPNNVREGLSPLRAVLREIFTDDEAANYSASLLRNMGVAGLFIVPRENANMSRDTAEVMKAKFKERFTGDRRGEPFVSNMPLDIKNISFSPSEMNLRDVRTIPEERVCAVLGIPAIVAGLGAGLSRSTFSNMAEAREMAYENGIIPLQRLIATDLTTQLLQEFDPNPNLQITFNNLDIRILQEDRTSEANRAAALFAGGVITRAEARVMTGFRSEDIDDIFRAPTNINEVERGERAPAAQQGGQQGMIMAADNLTTNEKGRLDPNRIESKEKETTRREFIEALEKDELLLSSIFANNLQKEFDQVAKEIAEQYLKHIEVQPEVVASVNGNSPAHQSTIERKDQLIILEDIGELVATVLSGSGAVEASSKRLELLYINHYKRVATRTFEHVGKRVGVSLVFNEQDAIGQSVLATGGRRKGLVDFTAQAKRAMFETIRQGREDGQNPRQIARSIRKKVPVGRFTRMAEERGVDAAKTYRSNMIARTETHNAQRVSTVSGYEASEVVETVRAIDAKYGDTDDICMERNGQEFTLEEARVETELEHPNGTLDWEPIIRSPKENDNQLRFSRNDTKLVVKAGEALQATKNNISKSKEGL